MRFKATAVRPIYILLSMLCLAVLPVATGAERPGTDIAVVTAEPAESEDNFAMTIEVSLVNLYATVVDRDGGVVRGLTRDDFLIEEEGREQAISHFVSNRDSALSLAVLLDISGSMEIAERFKQSRTVISSLATRLSIRDEMALFTFADHRVGNPVPFTSEKSRIIEEMEGLEPFGKTALFEAIREMPDILGDPKNRQAVILFTDGRDNASSTTMTDALGDFAHIAVPIFALCFEDWSFLPAGSADASEPSVLEAIAEATGGAYFEIPPGDDIVPLMERIFSELRYQYLLGYRSTGGAGAGDYRSIDLRTRNSRYTVRARKGYHPSN